MTSQANSPLAFIAGGGEMGERTRAFDWSTTPVGPASSWPQSLKTAVRIMLDSRYAMWLGWGPEFTFFYNDAYAAMSLGPKHPWALGRSAREVWAEIWNDIGPRAESVIRTGQATWDEGLLLFLERRGFPEETYHTFSYSPIPDDTGAVGGMLCVVTEDTERTIGERRLRTLRELAARTTEETKSAEEACQTAARILADNPFDLPFALIYLLDKDGMAARLAGSTGLPEQSLAAPATIDSHPENHVGMAWPFHAVLQSGQAILVPELGTRFGSLHCGPWPESTRQAIVVPMAKPGQMGPAGFLVAGISPRLVWHEAYKGFVELVAGQVATAVANARAYEEERKRAEALAELDRAKTAFFSNVSHEFRTPLTLMLGPVEDMLARSYTELSPAAKTQLQVVNRNGLRLLRLVNALLDFSRIEAGRVRATYQPTDLAAFTGELASVFRSACERAGLQLQVDCGPLSAPVYVDRDMWEKIVLNLLSNAFKFTFTGKIVVSLRETAHAAELRVRDTGTGIPPEEMSRLFERFHRVKNAQGRTHEGSGIGLALVQELVKLHGGAIGAESAVGEGTAFIVAIPLGSAHLPPEQIAASGGMAATGTGATPYVEEALRWLPEPTNGHAELPAYEEPLPTPIPGPEDDRPTVLVADDNADMRQYLVRLLRELYHVHAVPDGQAAMAWMRERTPDLVLTDVMMPKLDGFGLLQALRADQKTRSLPVIMLSARAGEESRVEGMQAGADDYLVKPFSARELLARVSAHFQMARLRQEASATLHASEERFQTFMDNSPTTAFIKDGDGRYLYVNRLIERQFNRPAAQWLGKTDFELFSPEEAHAIRQNDASVLTAGKTAEFLEECTQPDGLHYYVSFKFPIQDRNGAWLLAGMSIDVTEQRRAEEELREAELRFKAVFNQQFQFMAILRPDGMVVEANDTCFRATGVQHGQVIGRPFWETAWWTGLPEVQAWWKKQIGCVVAGGGPCTGEVDYRQADGTLRHADAVVSGLKDGMGRIVNVIIEGRDITERKVQQEALRANEQRLRTMAEALPNLLWTDLPDGQCDWLSSQWGKYTGIPEQELLGLRWLETVLHPDDRERTLACWQAACADQGAYDLEYRIRRHDGAYHWFKTRGVPLRDEHGKIVYWFGTCTDIEDVKRLEAALREADGRKDEFLATLAHELRNPLAPLRTGLQIMKLARGESDSMEQTRAMMERQLMQLVRLVDDLMDVSRITRGKIELRKERVEVARVIHHAIETSRPLIDANGHELLIDVPVQPIYVNADVTRLAQVISNLLNNAAKYTEHGGRITVSVKHDHGHAMLSVRDTGIGIPPHMLPHVFELFTQVDGSLDRSQGGLGIGLTLVKRLVEMHGGCVEAHSEGRGMGSEFVIRLPVVLALVDEESADDGRTAETSARRRILVADDNRDAAISLALMLKIMGNEVQTAHDGMEALQAAAAFRPDVILLDIGMPNVNGYEAASRIRQQPWGKKITLVAVTGWGQDDDRRRSHEAGFDFHVVKPVEPAQLEKLLGELKSVTA